MPKLSKYYPKVIKVYRIIKLAATLPLPTESAYAN